MKAENVMTRNVVTVSLETSVAEIAKLLVKHQISAVPVVDHDNRILGIVSEGDLMRRPETETERHGSWWLQAVTDQEMLAREYIKSHGADAQNVMTRNVVTVTEKTSLGEIAHTLEANRIKRVPVVRDDRLVGIVSRANIIQALAAKKSRIDADVHVDDDRIRTELLETLKNEPWVSTASLNVVVNEGVVHLYGTVGSAAERSAIGVAAHNVRGVQSVEDHLHVQPTMSEYP